MSDQTLPTSAELRDDMRRQIATLTAENERLRSIVARFVALPSGAWYPERHAAEEMELVEEARTALSLPGSDTL